MCQSEISIACLPTALSEAERARSVVLRAELALLLDGAQALANGYAWRLRDDATALAVLGEWVRLERRCCPFLSFELAWSTSESGPLFRVSGPEGTKEFLRAELPLLAADDGPR